MPKCKFGLGSCKSDATHVAIRKAGWQHHMNFDSLLMMKKWRKKTKSPICDWHRARLEAKYPGEYSFRAAGNLEDRDE